MFPTAPNTEVTDQGEIVYSEVVRENCKLEAYVEEMARNGVANIQKVQDDVVQLWTAVKSLYEISVDLKNHFMSLYESAVAPFIRAQILVPDWTLKVAPRLPNSFVLRSC